MAFTDKSYLPIGTNVTYQRGDGAQVTISVEASGEPTRLADMPLVTAPVMPLQLLTPEGLPNKAASKLIPPTPTGSRSFADGDVFDNPIIGGRFTIFVLLYGPVQYHAMHRRCLDAILGTVPTSRMDLRLISNELCDETVAYIDQLLADGRCSKHYRHLENRKKYPVMREAFYDKENPITTNWLLWFDDDSMADVNPHWLLELSKLIVSSYPAPEKYRMFGAKYIWALQGGQAAAYRARPWFRGKPFRMGNGRPSPNGNKVIFATGGFWALHTETMRICQIPDPELGHNGGDVMIGEQLYQNGFTVRGFNGDKSMVLTSSVERRGLNEKPFGSNVRRS